MLSNTKTIFDGLSSRIDSLLNRISNIQQEKIKLLSDYSELRNYQDSIVKNLKEQININYTTLIKENNTLSEPINIPKLLDSKVSNGNFVELMRDSNDYNQLLTFNETLNEIRLQIVSLSMKDKFDNEFIKSDKVTLEKEKESKIRELESLILNVNEQELQANSYIDLLKIPISRPEIAEVKKEIDDIINRIIENIKLYENLKEKINTEKFRISKIDITKANSLAEITSVKAELQLDKNRELLEEKDRLKNEIKKVYQEGDIKKNEVNKILEEIAINLEEEKKKLEARLNGFISSMDASLKKSKEGPSWMQGKIPEIEQVQGDLRRIRSSVDVLLQNKKGLELEETLEKVDTTINEPTIIKKVANIREDLLGAVRIIIRVNNLFNSDEYILKVASDNKNIIFNKTCEKYIKPPSKVRVGQSLGPFFKVVDTKDNAKFFDSINKNDLGEDIKVDTGMFDQIKNGYNLVIFGTGYSGTGKTFTLFGNQRDPGLTQLIFNYLGDSSAQLENIEEFYGLMLPRFSSVKSEEIIDINGRYKQSSPYRIELNDTEYQNKIEGVKEEFNKSKDIQKLVENLEKIRKQGYKLDLNKIKGNFDGSNFQNKLRIINLATIRSTPNNPVSSRSHLFLTFKFSDPSWGKLTIVDMGGIEDPMKIREIYNSIGLKKFEYIDTKLEEPLANKLFFSYQAKYDRNEELNVNTINDINVQPSSILELRKYYMEKSDGNTIDSKINNLYELYNKLKENPNNKMAILNKYYNYVLSQDNALSSIKDIAEINRQIKEKNILLKQILDPTKRDPIRREILDLENKIRSINKTLGDSISIPTPLFDFFIDSYLILSEGFYINESLNQLIAFFKSKVSPIIPRIDKNEYQKYIGINIKEKKATDFVEKQEISYNKYGSFYPSEIPDLINNKTKFDRIGVITKLKELEGVSSDKPTKFIMIGLLNPKDDERYCDGAISVIEFSEKVASTAGGE